MKQFTRHTFMTKCIINFHHFFLTSADSIVLAFLITYIHNSHMFRVISDGLRTCNFNFFVAFSFFLVTVSSVRGSEFVERRTARLSCHTTAVTFSCCIFLDSPLFNFKAAGFLNSVGQFFLFALAVPQLYVSFSNSIFMRFVEVKKLSK